MNCKLVAENIRANLKKYIRDNGLKALVIGVSGGIDSTLCCALAEPVCKELGIPLIGRSLPTGSNKPDEAKRANDVGKFCTDFLEVNIDHTTDDLNCMMVSREWDAGRESKCKDETRDKMRKGNIKARTRMIYLYNLAFIHEGIVLSTDNFSEFNLGFWTLSGDVGDYGMIQNLWKTEVYELAKYIEEELIANGRLEEANTMGEGIIAIPTDGLGISNSDLDQIGAPTYKDVDQILKTWLCSDEDSFYYDEEFLFPERTTDYGAFKVSRELLKNHPVVARHEKTFFKRAWPITISRKNLFKEESG